MADRTPIFALFSAEAVSQVGNTLEQFLEEIGEPVSDPSSPPQGSPDMDKLQASAQRTGGVEFVVPSEEEAGP